MKTVTKKLFAMMLAVVMLFSVVPFGAAASGMSDAPAAQTNRKGKKNVVEVVVNLRNVAAVDDDFDETLQFDISKGAVPLNAQWVKGLVEEHYGKGVEADTAYVIISQVPYEDHNLLADGPYVLTKNVIVEISVSKAVVPVPTEPETEPETEPASNTVNVTIKEASKKNVRAKIDAVGGVMDILALLSERGYAVGEYDVAVDGIDYAVADLNAVPAPASGKSVVELSARNEVEPTTPAPTTPAPAGKVDVTAIEGKNKKYLEAELSEDGETVNLLDCLAPAFDMLPEYKFEINNRTYEVGDLEDFPAPSSGKITVTLTRENVADAGESSRHPVVTFIANGGSWGRGKTEMSVTVRRGHTLGDQMPDEPTLRGETFAGWRIVDTDEYIDEDTKIYEDTNVEAVWVGRRDRFTITFDPNGGSLSRRDPKSIEVRYNEVLDDLPVPTHRNLDFQGWFDQTGKQWEDGDIFNIAYDITLTAKWARSARVVLHVYMDGNTKNSVYDIELDDYVVGDYITMKHVKRDIWEAGIEAKPGKQLEYDGLFNSDTWERYVRRGRGGANEIEIENVRRNDIYVMVFNGQTHHRPWDPTNPKTGDQMMLEGAIVVMALAAVGVVTLTTLRKKKVL